MIEQRPLIQDIPAGKFHSVLMTSYSINLYYWEIQLLKTLSGKGINFVSAIVDSDCLSDQLLKFSKAFSGKKPLEFSLHGYKSKGAFHPKIQFYAGSDTVLVLIGSGNLTVSGHGKNMEVWTPIMVDSVKSSAYPIIRDVWQYLSSIYNELGDEAYNIIRAVESNCSLLQEEYVSSKNGYQIDEETYIRLFVDGESTLFSQCQDWIGDERIRTITVMSPFYDSHAELIKALYSIYLPENINIIVENGFGTPPSPKHIPSYVKIFKWDKVIPNNKKYQQFFHSKCIFFEGQDHHYLLCGSANASVAAFGKPGTSSSNREANVGYKSSSIDYFSESGIRLMDPIPPSEIKTFENNSPETQKGKTTIWIKEASYEYDHYIVKTHNFFDVNIANITFYSGDRLKSESFEYNAKAGIFIQEGKFRSTFHPLYVEITDKSGKIISNRQFVIPTVSMIVNDPSTESLTYRRRCHDIESGQFVNGAVLRFIEQILSDAETKISAKNRNNKKEKEDFKTKQGNQFTSFEEYIKDDGNGITGDYKTRKRDTSLSQSTLLFDSIVSYIGKSAKEKEEENIDDEETEDVRNSSGKERKKSSVLQTSSSKSMEDVKKRVRKMLYKYMEHLEVIALEALPKPMAINLFEELKKFMTAVYFLNRAISYRYVTKDEPCEEKALIDIPYSIDGRRSVTEYFYRLINLFALFVMKCKKDEEANRIIKDKIERYKQYAFELCVTVMSILDWLNDGNPQYEIVKFLKDSSLQNIKKALDGEVSTNSVVDIFGRIDKPIQDLNGFDKSHIEFIINSNLTSLIKKSKLYPKGVLAWTNEFGYVRLRPFPTQSVSALPCTMAFPYDYARHTHCPEYVYIYKRKQLVRILKK